MVEGLTTPAFTGMKRHRLLKQVEQRSFKKEQQRQTRIKSRKDVSTARMRGKQRAMGKQQKRKMRGKALKKFGSKVGKSIVKSLVSTFG